MDAYNNALARQVSLDREAGADVAKAEAAKQAKIDQATKDKTTGTATAAGVKAAAVAAAKKWADETVAAAREQAAGVVKAATDAKDSALGDAARSFRSRIQGTYPHARYTMTEDREAVGASVQVQDRRQRTHTEGGD